MTENTTNPTCCGQVMHKAGWSWSGHNKVQRWKCQRCGRTTTIPGQKTEEK